MTTLTYTAAQQAFGDTVADNNWAALTPGQREYFEHLAANDPLRTAQAFYEDTVPLELQDKPELVEKYLNGDAALGVSDKDWSHDVSRHNGGSDSADNGRFEDASVNRSRGADNTTPEEVFEAEAASKEDTRTLLESVEDTADATVWAEAAEVAGGAADLALDFLAPAVGAGVAAKAVVDNCDTVEKKVGWGLTTFGTTFWLLTTPPGQVAVAGYLGYRLTKRGLKLWEKHVAPHVVVN